MNDGNDTITPALTAEQLAQVNRLATVARFVSALAHELNNSLQIMSGLVELLVDREDLPADVLVRLGRVGAQADLASGKLKQVIGYVREPAAEGERLELGAIVDRALTLRSYELGRSGISVGWELPLERFPVARKPARPSTGRAESARQRAGGACPRTNPRAARPSLPVGRRHPTRDRR